ncbi:MAG: hypothetical protein JGK36_13390 [Microcoleus sp. PH2017_35_SFW_U_B]|nr:hypothetical protein [Microcoleus sp. PH2017_35_SFW_U_B]
MSASADEEIWNLRNPGGRRNMEFEKSRRLETAPTQTMSASADEEIWNLREMCD